MKQLKTVPKQEQQSPDDVLRECELTGCNRIFRTADSFSYRLVAHHSGPIHPETKASIPSFQCDQHYACSPAHARAIMLACFDEHIIMSRELWWWGEHSKYVSQSLQDAQKTVAISYRDMIQYE